MSKQTVLDQRVIVDDIECKRNAVVAALGAADYMLGNQSEWNDFLFDEEEINYDKLCRIIGAVKVPRKITVGSLQDMKSYLLNEERTLADQLSMEKDKLLQLMTMERSQVRRHAQICYDDLHNKLKELDQGSTEWHRTQAKMDILSEILFMTSQPIG